MTKCLTVSKLVETEVSSRISASYNSKFVTDSTAALHFKLAVSADGSSDKFDDAQFIYIPQLGSARDEELIDLLPDYLVEEITFPRLHAAKFYSRVVKALSERPE